MSSVKEITYLLLLNFSTEQDVVDHTGWLAGQQPGATYRNGQCSSVHTNHKIMPFCKQHKNNNNTA